jgi:hypothetical protein
MPPTKRVDPEQIKALHLLGHGIAEIAARMSISATAVTYHMGKMGITPNPRRKPRQESALATVQPEPVLSAQSSLAILAAPKVQGGNGTAKARVVMFEIEGGDQTILAAIETVKAALSKVTP